MTKSLDNIEQKMKDMDAGSLRYHILENAKNFKVSWVELGRALYTVWKEKLYKDWGYTTLDAYTGKEIGIRKQTAMKLLKSYYFLEKEEPQYLKQEYIQGAEASVIPSYESVDLLRQAKTRGDLLYRRSRVTGGNREYYARRPRPGEYLAGAIRLFSKYPGRRAW